MTYKEAYNKIIDAYFKDEIKPMDMKFCFCGTLAKGLKEYRYETGWFSDDYSKNEFLDMEEALMKELKAEGRRGNWSCFSHNPDGEDYENRLFNGMCAALEVLKEIHRSRGENVDEVPTFTKRQLA